MRARVLVTLKTEVLDPQGEAVQRGLVALGIAGVKGVRVGKVIELEVDGPREQAQPKLEEAAKKLFSNPVIEDYRIEWE